MEEGLIIIKHWDEVNKMIELLRESPHAPVEVVAVQEHRVEALLATGNYKRVGGVEKDFIPAGNVAKKEDVFFSFKMTEKEIKEKIEKYDIPVKYDIDKERKADKLKELEDMEYNVIWK